MDHMIGIIFKGTGIPSNVRQALFASAAVSQTHSFRVFNLATTLAKSEEAVKDIELVQLAALLHDIDDWKYSGSETAGVDAAQKWLQICGYPQDKIDTIKRIIHGVSFKNELATGAADVFPELAVVQDADRIDAIGAIGIARAFTFGGKKNRALWIPGEQARVSLTKAEYMNQSNNTSTIAHFHEKLLKLKDMMKTESGRRLAQKRHEYMEGFLQQFENEWNGLS